MDGLIRSHHQNNLCLAEGFKNWLRVRNYSPRTQEDYLRVVYWWLEFLGPDDARTITHSRIRAYLSASPQGDAALRFRLAALKQFYRFLLLAKAIAFSPASFIQHRRWQPRKPPRVLTESEIERLMNAAETPRNRAILELIYGTGCRVSEIVGMNIEQIDFQHGEIKVVGKGDKERIVFFGKRAANALENYLAGDYQVHFANLRRAVENDGRPQCKIAQMAGMYPQRLDYAKNGCADLTRRECERLADALGCEHSHLFKIYRRTRGPLFVGARNGRQQSRIQKQQIEIIVRDAGRRAGVPHITPHGLRHAFATHLIEHGVDIRFIQEFLGHASLAATQIYTQVSISRLIEIHRESHPLAKGESNA